jgi:hypothetical protein
MIFCTIITSNYIHYALALRESLLQFNQDIQLYILVSDEKAGLKNMVQTDYPQTYIIYPDEVCGDGLGKAIYDKYASNYMDAFRWSMKPVLLTYLLQKKGADKVIYVDCDIHFYSDYGFLFDELEQSNVLLTPHWRSSDPIADEFNFLQLYIYGLYNGGFVGVNSKAVAALEWWANANLFICEVNASKGQYVDQTHLNLLPIYFDKIVSLKHRGCNVAGWNLLECKRTLDADGTVLINYEWPIVFIHYSESTVHFINIGEDELLLPHMTVYTKRVKFYEEKLGLKTSKPENKEFKTSTNGLPFKILYRIKNKLKGILK